MIEDKKNITENQEEVSNTGGGLVDALHKQVVEVQQIQSGDDDAAKPIDDEEAEMGHS